MSNPIDLLNMNLEDYTRAVLDSPPADDKPTVGSDTSLAPDESDTEFVERAMQQQDFWTPDEMYMLEAISAGEYVDPFAVQEFRSELDSGAARAKPPQQAAVRERIPDELLDKEELAERHAGAQSASGGFAPYTPPVTSVSRKMDTTGWWRK